MLLKPFAICSLHQFVFFLISNPTQTNTFVNYNKKWILRQMKNKTRTQICKPKYVLESRDLKSLSPTAIKVFEHSVPVHISLMIDM